MMDEDFGWDDTVGRIELEVDDLLVNTRTTDKIAISEVGLLRSTYCLNNSQQQANNVSVLFPHIHHDANSIA